MSKQSPLLANVSILLATIILGVSIGTADTMQSDASTSMEEKPAMQEAMNMDKETGMTEEKMGMEKKAGMQEDSEMEETDSMSEDKLMEMGKDKMKETMSMENTDGKL